MVEDLLCQQVQRGHEVLRVRAICAFYIVSVGIFDQVLREIRFVEQTDAQSFRRPRPSFGTLTRSALFGGQSV